MENESIEVLGSGATSSIKVSENAKGQFSHEIKIYFDNQTEDPKDIVKEIASISKDLNEKFPIKG